MTHRPDRTQCEQPEVDPHISDDWPDRLRRAVEQTITARQARRDQRAQFAARRDAGLRARHAAKLGRAQRTEMLNVGRSSVQAARKVQERTVPDATGPTTGDASGSQVEPFTPKGSNPKPDIHIAEPPGVTVSDETPTGRLVDLHHETGLHIPAQPNEEN